MSSCGPMVYLPGEGDGVLAGPPRHVLPRLELAPPLVALARALEWDPLPLTIKEGKKFNRQVRGKAVAAERPPQPPRSDAPFLQVHDVKVDYGGQPVVRGVRLEVWLGEIVVLMGRNGSGKTTLLKSLVGLVRPQAGQV